MMRQCISCQISKTSQSLALYWDCMFYRVYFCSKVLFICSKIRMNTQIKWKFQSWLWNHLTWCHNFDAVHRSGCGVLRCVAVCCRVLPCVAVCCSVLQRVAVCCSMSGPSVLQCVVSVLQRVGCWEKKKSQKMAVYGVATTSRLLEIIGLFCKRALSKRLYSAKETYNFQEPTNRSHPMGTLYRVTRRIQGVEDP